MKASTNVKQFKIKVMISSGKHIQAKNLLFRCVVYVKIGIQIYEERFDIKYPHKKTFRMKSKIHILQLFKIPYK